MRSVNYMCRVIEDYIYHRKNKRVKITPRQDEMLSVIRAYNYALTWFNTNQV